MAWMVYDYPEPGDRYASAPHCPICGQACSTLYRDIDFAVVGCDECVTATDAAEEAVCCEREV